MVGSFNLICLCWSRSNCWRYFSVFGEDPIELENGSLKESVMIDHPENIQYFHVQNIKNHLLQKSEHPSTGATAAHTSWVLDNILGKNN